MRRSPSRRAFSLLEVMVAVSILGLALTVILSAQGGLAASNKMAANMGSATTIARCKMTEMEERFLKLGYPELDEVDPQAICCEGLDTTKFTCATRVEKVQLPNPPDNSLGDGGFMASPSASGSAPPGLPGSMPPIPGLAASNPGGTGQLNLDLDAGLQGIGAQVQGQLNAVGGANGLLNMVMGIVYPSLKPMLETSIRRLTVTVKWKEGPNEKEFSVVQYVTNPQRSGFVNGVLVGDAGVGTPAGTGGSGGSGTPAATPGFLR
jgi:general secretion pathway protein I